MPAQPIPAVAIIPAHNEAPRIAAVLRPLKQSGAFARIVVVDDGSTDGTADVAISNGVEVIQLSPNRGKGQAMLAGVSHTTEPLVAFFDADLIGLRPEHAWQLLNPIGPCVMCVGLRDYGAYNRLQNALPPITGERAVLRSVLNRMPAEFWSGFAVEVGMNATARVMGPTCRVQLHGVKIVPKWQKIGVRQGILDAAKMAREVLIAMKRAG